MHNASLAWCIISIPINRSLECLPFFFVSIRRSVKLKRLSEKNAFVHLMGLYLFFRQAFFMYVFKPFCKIHKPYCKAFSLWNQSIEHFNWDSVKFFLITLFLFYFLSLYHLQANFWCLICVNHIFSVSYLQYSVKND